MSEPTKILVVEDEWIVARAIQKTLESEGFEVVTVTAPAEALRLVEDAPPDLVLLDIVLGQEMDGVSLALEIRSRRAIPIVFVTAHADAHILTRAAAAEPAGFVVKPFQEAQLISSVTMAIQQLARPLRPVTAETGAAPSGNGSEEDSRRRQIDRVAAAVSTGAAASVRGTDLTSREVEVVRLLLSNGRVRSIAETLQISPHTVRNHLRSIFRKLGVHSQVELIKELSSRASSSSSVGAA